MAAESQIFANQQNEQKTEDRKPGKQDNRVQVIRITGNQEKPIHSP